jgi:hypothetical protein
MLLNTRKRRFQQPRHRQIDGTQRAGAATYFNFLFEKGPSDFSVGNSAQAFLG